MPRVFLVIRVFLSLINFGIQKAKIYDKLIVFLEINFNCFKKGIKY